MALLDASCSFPTCGLQLEVPFDVTTGGHGIGPSQIEYDLSGFIELSLGSLEGGEGRIGGKGLHIEIDRRYSTRRDGESSSLTKGSNILILEKGGRERERERWR